MMHGHNMLLGHKVKCYGYGLVYFIRSLWNERTVGAFTLTVLICCSQWKTILPQIFCSVCWLHGGRQCQSPKQFPSRLACVHKCGGFIVSRFSLIDESKDVVPARQLFSPSLAPQRASLLSDIAADQRRENTVNLQSEPLKVQIIFFLCLTDEDDFGFW